jgi:hypothetical protein
LLAAPGHAYNLLDFDLAFASIAANTTCCGLLKQPDKLKSANRLGTGQTTISKG